MKDLAVKPGAPKREKKFDLFQNFLVSYPEWAE